MRNLAYSYCQAWIELPRHIRRCRLRPRQSV